jgi:hypothetical protein
MKIWITWYLPFHFIEIIGFVILFFSYLYLYWKKKIMPFTVKNQLFFFSLLIMCLYNAFFNNNLFVINIIGQLILYSYAFFILSLSKYQQLKLLNSITRWFSWLLFPSIVIYLILLVVDIPHLGAIAPPERDNQASYGEYLNYLFYVRRNYKLSMFNFIRFNGPFIEPGHLGMISAFLLYANKYNFKKIEVWIIFVALLLSFSLAGYLLLLAGYMLTAVYNIKRIIISVIILSSSIYIITKYYEDNPFTELIINKFNDSTSENYVDVRFSDDTNYFFTKYLKRGKLIFGTKEIFPQGAGYKTYILHYGIIGVILVFWFYFLVTCFAVEKRYAYCFLLLISLAFMQRTYPMWCAWFLPFITGISSNDIVKKKKRKLYLI